MNGERLHRHICLECHRKPWLGRMWKGVFHCRIWEKANRQITIRVLLFLAERLSSTLSLGGYPWGPPGTWGFPISHQPRLITDTPVFSELCLSSLWLDPFICRPRPAFCRLFPSTVQSHTYLFTRSIPPFRPTIDLLTVLSTVFPPLTQNLLYLQTPSCYGSSIPGFTFTCFYLSIFSSHRSDYSFYMPIHTSRAQI